MKEGGTGTEGSTTFRVEGDYTEWAEGGRGRREGGLRRGAACLVTMGGSGRRLLREPPGGLEAREGVASERTRVRTFCRCLVGVLVTGGAASLMPWYARPSHTRTAISPPPRICEGLLHWACKRSPRGAGRQRPLDALLSPAPPGYRAQKALQNHDRKQDGRRDTSASAPRTDTAMGGRLPVRLFLSWRQKIDVPTCRGNSLLGVTYHRGGRLIQERCRQERPGEHHPCRMSCSKPRPQGG